MIKSRSKPLIIFDARYPSSKTVGELGGFINENAMILENQLQPLLNQSFTDLVTVTGPYSLGTLVQQQSNSNAILADASKRIAANSIVTSALPSSKALILPFAKLTMPITSLKAVSGFQALWLGDSGNVTGIEPLSGFVQAVGWVNYFDMLHNSYSITFLPSAPQFVG